MSKVRSGGGVPTELVQGTLEMLILKTLLLSRCTVTASHCASSRSATGFSASIRDRSFRLCRLERSGRPEADGVATENNRRAKYYS